MVTASPHAANVTDPDTSVHRPEAVVALWFGLLLAPAAYLASLLAVYAIAAEPCSQRHDLLLQAIHGAAVLLGLIGMSLAWSSHRITRKNHGASALGPGVRFLARVSLGSNALFLLVMLVQWAPSLVYSQCR